MFVCCAVNYSLYIETEPVCVCVFSFSGWREKKYSFRYIFSFAVATHHLLREIRVNHQNIKEADIYLECSCGCVYVSLVST